MNIVIPSKVYLSVKFVEQGTPAEIIASYKGVTLEATYPGIAPLELRVYFTGDFAADYAAALEWVQGWGQADTPVPFYASSTLDTFMYYAEQGEADSEAIAEAEAGWAAQDAYKEALENDLPFLPTTEANKVVLLNNRLAAAWQRVPPVKLQWALANVIASSDYNTEYPHSPLGRDRALQALKVLDELLADEALGRATRS